VNKLWTDAELSLFENIYIPVNASLLSTLRTVDPTLNVVQNLSPTTTRLRKTTTNATPNDAKISLIRPSDSSTSIPTTNNSSYEDYFSKIDQLIRTSKKSLQTRDVTKQYPM
jgi:hypothetical protein